jgi:hypothetical protein
MKAAVKLEAEWKEWTGFGVEGEMRMNIAISRVE